MKLFGWEITREDEKTSQDDVTHKKAFTPPVYDDGALTVTSGSHYGVYVDMEGVVRNEMELITRYREMAIQPELDDAISDVINEAIVYDEKGKSVELQLDELEVSDNIKEKIKDEFDYVLKMLNFADLGQDIFRTWYIDGRLFYHAIIDEKDPTKGVQELRYVDPRKIRKVREIVKGRDPVTGMEIIQRELTYYIYNERGLTGAPGAQYTNMGQRIATDTIVNINSGLLDSKRQMVISHLHKAIKPLNQLRMVEDATVIYRLSRAPERRIFYIDVGTLPTQKAQQYLQSIMTQYRNKLVYNASTGEIRDDRRHLAMLEDYWLPRREGGRSTQIDTLPGGQNLGQIEDVEYFEKKLYKSLGIPFSRTQPETGFSLGRSTEITRDELKFSKLIDRLRNKFSGLFDELLRRQLVLKRIITEDEWNEFKQDIFYDWLEDNNFTELKEAELNRERLSMLQVIEPYVGRYYSLDWTYKNILRLTDDEIEEMQQQIQDEKDSGVYDDLGIGGVNPMDQLDGMGDPGMDPSAGAPPPDDGGGDTGGGDSGPTIPKMPANTALVNTESVRVKALREYLKS